MSDQPNDPVEEDFDPERERDDNDEVEEVTEVDLDELNDHLQETLREHEASEDYGDEPDEEVED